MILATFYMFNEGQLLEDETIEEVNSNCQCIDKVQVPTINSKYSRDTNYHVGNRIHLESNFDADGLTQPTTPFPFYQVAHLNRKDGPTKHCVGLLDH